MTLARRARPWPNKMHFLLFLSRSFYPYPPRLSHARTEDRLARLRAVTGSFVIEISQGADNPFSSAPPPSTFADPLPAVQQGKESSSLWTFPGIGDLHGLPGDKVSGQCIRTAAQSSSTTSICTAISSSSTLHRHPRLHCDLIINPAVRYPL